jgi:chromate reductase
LKWRAIEIIVLHFFSTEFLQTTGMNHYKKNILAISGSTRKHSTNEAILKQIIDLYKEELNITLYDQIDQLPHFNPDLDKTVVPSSVIDFRDAIEKADGVVICTPEYVFSLPGTLKNALEWTVSTTVFSDKPFAYIVASASGEKTFESMDLIMSTLLQYKIPESNKLLIRGSRARVTDEKISDPETLIEIKKLIEALVLEMNKSNQAVL